MLDYNDETDPNDLLDLMRPGEELEAFRKRIRKFYWKVQHDLVGSTTEEVVLMDRLHRHLRWFGAKA
jgi:hypothetical protein